MWFAWVIWGEFFLKKIFQKATQKFIFPYKQVSGRNGNHEWFRMTNANAYTYSMILYGIEVYGSACKTYMEFQVQEDRSLKILFHKHYRTYGLYKNLNLPNVQNINKFTILYTNTIKVCYLQYLMSSTHGEMRFIVISLVIQQNCISGNHLMKMANKCYNITSAFWVFNVASSIAVDINPVRVTNYIWIYTSNWLYSNKLHV